MEIEAGQASLYFKCEVCSDQNFSLIASAGHMWPTSYKLPTADLDHYILHKIVTTAKKSILVPLHVADINLSIFVGLS